jgi:hypothetical protein
MKSCLDVLCGRRPDQQHSGSVSGSAVVEKGDTLGKEGAANCHIRSTEGLKTPLELTLSFLGDAGSEVGSPVDLSKFAREDWTENGKKLGVTYEGTHSSRKLQRTSHTLQQPHIQPWLPAFTGTGAGERLAISRTLTRAPWPKVVHGRPSWPQPCFFSACFWKRTP